MKTLLTYLLLFAFCFLNAQEKTDSVITLPEVTKLECITTVMRESRISSYRYVAEKNISEALRDGIGIYFKNYGQGQVSSISIRGTSAAQTDLLWNGVKLNSPSLGQVDASLFNLGMSDQLEVGGISSTGNVGGFVNLKNELWPDSGVSLNATVSYGSFNTLRASARVKYGNGKFSGATRVGYLSSDNDYLFINTYKAGNPEEKLSNAKVQLFSFMEQFNAKINANQLLQYNLWFTDAYRQIPPVISKPQSKEAQDDYSLRNALIWKGKFHRVSTNFTSAFLHDVIFYRNPEISLSERSIMEAFRNNFSITIDSLKKFTVNADAGYDFERAMVPSYQQTRKRHIAKVSVGLKYEPVEEVLLNLQLREQLYDKALSPFSPLLAIRYYKRFNYEHGFVARLTGSRNFRFPTLNDLYWVPGGNPNLKTEKSWDGEAGIQYTYNSIFNLKANAFCKYITNWIQWIPDGGYWAPQNVKRVLTRGIEIHASIEGPYRYIDQDFNLGLNINYTYTRATNLDAITPADQSKGKQLIYVPLHVANALVHIEYKKFFLRASNTYTGAVFITTDNSEALKDYYLLDLEAGKDFVIKRYEIGASFKVNNVTDKQYQTVAQRPMPGRNFEGTLRFKFN